MNKSPILMILMLLVMTLNPKLALANSVQNKEIDLNEIKSLEQCFFSCAHNEQSPEVRLEKLELLTFGSTFTNEDYSTRLKKLAILASKQKSINENRPAQILVNTQMPLPAQGNNQQQFSQNTNAQSFNNADNSSQRIKYMLQQATNAFRNGDKITARNLFEDILTLEPDNSDANFSLGIVYEAMGNLIQAATYYSIATQLEPENLEYREALNLTNKKLQSCL